MFTFAQSKRKVAKVVGGRRDGAVIHLVDEEQTPNELQCDQCGKIFTRKATLKQHIGNGVTSACKGKQIYDIKGGARGGDGKPVTFDHFDVDDDGRLQVLPGFSGERDVAFVVAPSGSGKSVWVSRYLQELAGSNGKPKPIYLFSGITDDPAFDKIPGLKQIKFDEDFANSPIDIEELHDSCVVFDDIGKLKQPYRDICKQLQDEILEKGRHFKIDCLSTNHLSTNGADTRNLINEANHVVVFPKASSMTETERILHKYIGLERKLIPKLQQLGGRSVYVSKNYPQFIVSDKKIARPQLQYFP